MANGSRSRVVGKGIVRFRLPSGKHVRLTNVRHVPGVRKNLISLGMLDVKGYSFTVIEGVLRVHRGVGRREMLEGRMIGGLYRLVGSVETGTKCSKNGIGDGDLSNSVEPGEGTRSPLSVRCSSLRSTPV